jgi:hypothetical protein
MVVAVVRTLLILFTVLYILALLIYAVGVFGWFGQERDPVSGVFLVLLGWPWSGLVDRFPEATWPWLSALAPLLNVGILAAILAMLKRLRLGA